MTEKHDTGSDRLNEALDALRRECREYDSGFTAYRLHRPDGVVGRVIDAAFTVLIEAGREV